MFALALIAAATSAAVPAAYAAGRWYQPPAPRRLDLAWKGDPRAQAYLGYLYSKGLGVPQNYRLSAFWYNCAATQGDPYGQFLMGMMFDKGLGVPQDYRLAFAWTDLATTHAPPGVRADWLRVRDAISTKLSLFDRTEGQRLAAIGPVGPPCVGDP